jgi:hypothetical protein
MNIKNFKINNPITHNSVELKLVNGTKMIGFFQDFEDSLQLEKDNLFYFIKNENNSNYLEAKDKKYATIINQNEVISINKL